jgi:transcriptional regulator with XRE-family HTH domain
MVMSPAALSTSAPSSVSDERIARRLAVLLAERRRQSGLSLRAVARASGGEFTARELKQIEAARVPLQRHRARAVADLYGIDLAAVTPDRLPLEIDPRGVISTGGSAISFEPDDVESLLTNYLRLVRSLRGQERPQAIELRRNDVETLAVFLEMPGELVVEQLAALMGATQLQRRVLAGMFVAGAMVIGLSAAAAANLQAAEGGRSEAPAKPPASETDWRD